MMKLAYAALGALEYLMDGSPMKERSPAELRTIHDLCLALIEHGAAAEVLQLSMMDLDALQREANQAYKAQVGEYIH